MPTPRQVSLTLTLPLTLTPTLTDGADSSAVCEIPDASPFKLQSASDLSRGCRERAMPSGWRANSCPLRVGGALKCWYASRSRFTYELGEFYL